MRVLVGVEVLGKFKIGHRPHKGRINSCRLWSLTDSPPAHGQIKRRNINLLGFLGRQFSSILSGNRSRSYLFVPLLDRVEIVCFFRPRGLFFNHAAHLRVVYFRLFLRLGLFGRGAFVEARLQLFFVFSGNCVFFFLGAAVLVLLTG